MDKEKKKILFVCQYFYPEVFRGNDIAFYLADEGHEVHVVTGIPNYPGGKFFDGYGWWKKRHEVVNGVKVTRLPIIPRGNNKIMLMLNYFSYLVVACVWMLFHAIGHKYDKVFVQQLSPVMMSLPGVNNRDGRVTISQDVPYPFSLLSYEIDFEPETGGYR